MPKITPFLWFDNQAEEAAKFYVSVFKKSKIGKITRYGKEGYEFHKMSEGKVMTVEFQIEGQKFTALNGGPVFNFNGGNLLSSIVRIRKRWTIIGKNFPKVEMKKHRCVAGSKTNMACHGKSFPLF